MIESSLPGLTRAIGKACRDMQQGKVIAYPTEAVFGLGCDALNKQALKKLRKIKNREHHKGFIVLCSSAEQLRKNIPSLALTKQQWDLLAQQQDYPTTWLLPIKNRIRNDVDHLLLGKYKTLAVRITEHPTAKQLCLKLGKPLVSSSANKAGAKPAKKMMLVRKHFRNSIDNYINASLGSASGPSQIIDISTGKIIRAAKR